MANHVLITGAASGIGRACADEFSEQGFDVIGWDLVPGEDPRCEIRSVDVTNWLDVAAAAEDLPPLHAVVTCAGKGLRGAVMDLPAESWNDVLSANVVGTAYTAMAAFPALQAGSGTLVTIGSITASSTFRVRAHYSVSKAGVVALARSLANEWAEHGIRVLCVSPGFTRTPMLEAGIAAGLTDMDVLLAHTPQRELIEPRELAASIRALTSDDFRRVTGANVLVDAGWESLTGF